MRAPLVASPFLQSDGMKATRLGRKNGAATAHPPIACGFAHLGRTFHHPCAVTSLAAGVFIVHARLPRATAAPAPPLGATISSAALVELSTAPHHAQTL